MKFQLDRPIPIAWTCVSNHVAITENLRWKFISFQQFTYNTVQVLQQWIGTHNKVILLCWKPTAYSIPLLDTNMQASHKQDVESSFRLLLLRLFTLLEDIPFSRVSNSHPSGPSSISQNGKFALLCTRKLLFSWKLMCISEVPVSNIANISLHSIKCHSQNL